MNFASYDHLVNIPRIFQHATVRPSALEYNLLSELGQTGPWRIAKGGSEVGRLI